MLKIEVFVSVNVGKDSRYFKVTFRTDDAREAVLKKHFEYEGK